MVDRRARLIVGAALALTLLAACGAEPFVDAAAGATTRQTATILLAGDAMLGRSVAPIIAADPDGIFADVRREIRLADIAAVNVESPLTLRPHVSPNPYALEADPQSAVLLANAGFDIAGIANNHAGDAGRASVLDSLAAVTAAGMQLVGGGPDLATAWTPVVVEVGDLNVAFLAVDGSQQGRGATLDEPGIASWNPDRARTAIAAARRDADVVVVGLHGGVEYRTRPDPLLTPLAEQIAGAGADVVWGHGPHVEQPITVIDPDGDGRPTIVATSLGNFLFDQHRPGTDTGILLEVLVDRDGLVAHRVADANHRDLRVHFDGWRPPAGNATLVAGGAWALDRAISTVDTSIRLSEFSEGIVVDASAGDLDGDGSEELLVSYRHPVRDKPGEPGPPPPVDTTGMSAHIGVIERDGTPVWLSRRPPHPVARVATCDGTAAFAYSTLNDDWIIATALGTWGGFGFVLEDELPGPGTVGCSDVNGDGLLDPVVLGRDAGSP